MCFELQFGATLFAILVQPVRGNAVFGDVMHALRADLNFYRGTVRADQRGMQRLIAIFLGDGNIVLELSRHRFVQAVQCTKRQITGRRVTNDDAESVDIEHLREAQALLDHFSIDRIQAFFAAEHSGFDIRFTQFAADATKNLGQQFAPVTAHGFERFGQDVETRRMDMLKRQVLELPGNIVEADPHRHGHIDFQGFPGNAPTFVRPHESHGLHVMQAISQFDEYDTQVAHHRHQHFAEIFCLRLLIALKLDFLEFRQTIHQVSDLLAEASRNFILGDGGVLDDIVQKRSDDGLDIQPPVSQQTRNR